MTKKGTGKFILGALVGAGLGILFAPNKGSETRKALKKKIDEFLCQIKEIDIEELKENLEIKIEEIKYELEDLDKEKVLAIAKKKSKEIIDKASELVQLAIDKGTPILRDAAEEVREKAVAVTKEVLKKLEKKETK